MTKLYKIGFIIFISFIFLLPSKKLYAQCDYNYIYNKITKTAKSDTLIIIRDFLPDKINNPSNTWVISLKANTKYRIYYFSENENDEMYIYKITKKEKIIVNSIFSKKNNNFVTILNTKDQIYQIKLKTENPNKCFFSALFYLQRE